jgi:hypothetical protein
MLKLRWRYPTEQWYEYETHDSAQVGKLYRLKALEPNIVQIELYKDDFLVIRYTRPDGGEND